MAQSSNALALYQNLPPKGCKTQLDINQNPQVQHSTSVERLDILQDYEGGYPMSFGNLWAYIYVLPIRPPHQCTQIQRHSYGAGMVLVW